VPHVEEGIHFYFDRRMVAHGFGWVFPCGANSRIGVGSYRGVGDIRQSLDLMLGRFGLKAGDIHGGFFPGRLRQPVSGDVFLVGDSAGQCEPLSGFGTRPALYFGFSCASIVQRVLDGRSTLEQGLQTYRRRVSRFQRYYRFLEWCQERPMELPEPLLVGLMKLASVKPICHDALNWHYLHSCLEEL
jgi:flavin-dependent dehydrogenase